MPMFLTAGKYVSPPPPPSNDIFIKLGEFGGGTSSISINMANYTDRYGELTVNDFYVMMGASNHVPYKKTDGTVNYYQEFNRGMRTTSSAYSASYLQIRSPFETTAPTFGTRYASGYVAIKPDMYKAYYPTTGLFSLDYYLIGSAIPTATSDVKDNRPGKCYYHVRDYHPYVYIIVCKSDNNLYGFNNITVTSSSQSTDVTISDLYPNKASLLSGGEPFYDILDISSNTTQTTNSTKFNHGSNGTTSSGHDGAVWAWVPTVNVLTSMTGSYPEITNGTIKYLKCYNYYIKRYGIKQGSNNAATYNSASSIVSPTTIKPYIYVPQ